MEMTQDEMIVMLISFVVGLVLKRPGIIQAGIEKVFRKDK
jgi:hypothetical protein